MSTPDPTTVEDLVAYLRHSSLPTVIVEGKDDMHIYQWVEACIGSQTANILPAGGREKLLCIYKERHEFADLPVAFVADKDMWLFSRIPSDYDGIIWTKGYSIENDLYTCADLENLLEAEEVQEHQQLMDAIVEWFAFEVERHLAGEDFEVAHHCNRVVPLGQTHMDENFRKIRSFRPPGEEIYRQIREAYQLQLRGKQLFEMLVRFLSAPDRDSKYSYDNLHEMAFKMTPAHPLMNRLIQEIERTIADQKTSLQRPKPSQ